MTRRTSLLCAILAVVGGVFVSDQWTKAFFDGQPSAPWPIPHVIGTTHHANHGFIANVPAPNALIMGVMVIAIILLCAAAARSVDRGQASDALAFALIIGGAIGNLTDRIVQGYVFDWLLLLDWSIVNLADIAIAAGIAWLVLGHAKRRPSA